MRFFRFYLLSATSSLALATLGVTSASAQTNWNGTSNNDWFDGTNWSDGSIPALGTQTNIDVFAGNPAPVISGGAAFSGLLAVGQNAAGNLTIQNGGRLETGPTLGSDIANVLGSTGTVTVTGAGSTWNIAGLLSVGTGGTGFLIIQNGGMVSNGGNGAYIGFSPRSVGTATVTGPGSVWNTAADLRVGGSVAGDGNGAPVGPGTGTLTIADGGAVNVIGGGGSVFVARPAGSTGTVNIGAAPGSAAVAPGFLNASQVLFGLGTAALNFNHTATNYVFAPTIAGTGAVNVFSGTTILTANNPYIGNTTISGGTLAVGDPAHPSAALSGGGNVTIAPGATLGGYGSVTGNVFNSGTVAPGSALPVFAGPFGSLTINGNYVGAGGLLNVRTVLAGDGSPSDKLVISQGTGTGSTRIRVTNAGGAGALTTGDGILVVQAINGATTTPNAFNLGRPISVGPYDYFLFRGGVSPGSQYSWFLRSSLVPGPTPSPVTPLYRPEVAVQSAVPSTALTLARVAVGTFNERQGDQLLLRGDRAPGVWGRVFGQQTREHFAQGAQPEFYGTYAGFQAGRDFLQLSTADGHIDHAGIYIAYARAVGDINGFVDGVEGASAGRLDLEANNVGGYWTHIGPSNWYIDAVLQGSFVSGSTTSDRQLTTGNYARAITASLEAGYPILLTPWLALEPQAQAIWQRLWINDALDSVSPIAFSHPEALTGRVGTLLRGTFGGPAAVWQPYLKGNVWFGGNGTDLVTFATTPVPVQRNHGTALEGGGGINGKLTQSISVYADASYLSSVSGEQWITLKGNVGLRVTW